MSSFYNSNMQYIERNVIKIVKFATQVLPQLITEVLEEHDNYFKASKGKFTY